MTKSTVTKTFFGSLIAIVAGLFVVALGLHARPGDRHVRDDGPDVTGFQLSASAPATFGLAFIGVHRDRRRRDRPVRRVDRRGRQHIAPRRQDLVRRPAGPRTPELRLRRDARLRPRRAGRHGDAAAARPVPPARPSDAYRRRADASRHQRSRHDHARRHQRLRPDRTPVPQGAHRARARRGGRRDQRPGRQPRSTPSCSSTTRPTGRTRVRSTTRTTP